MIQALSEVGALTGSFGILLPATGTFNTLIARRSTLEALRPGSPD